MFNAFRAGFEGDANHHDSLFITEHLAPDARTSFLPREVRVPGEWQAFGVHVGSLRLVSPKARHSSTGRASQSENTIVNEFAKTENGVVTFASSQGRETSQEFAAWGHGAFTEALIEGLGEGKADLLHKGSITVSELDAYIAERVKTLTEGRQHSVMSRPSTVPDFAFAVAK